MLGNSRNKKLDREYVRLLVKSSVIIILWLGSIFALAGRINYWQGWVFSIVTIVLIIINIILFSDNSELAKERTKPGPGTKWWDKIFYALYTPLCLAIYIVGSLDSGRYYWSGKASVMIYVLGYIFYILSQVIIMWSMKTNQYFSSVVRIQEDRGQYVIQEGPYKYVRHPGYIGGILLGLGMALTFGSYRALIPAVSSVVVITIRTYLEDTTLQNELPGYIDYTNKVRYRLFPGIW